MENKSKIIYDKLGNIKFSNKGYIDLRNSKVKTKQDLVTLCDVFRDPRYETFRIFYIKDDKIVGQEAITSRIPNLVVVFSSKKESKNNPTRSYERINNRMRRLGATGYYLAHNHISESSKPSLEDMSITYSFCNNVKGFLGHIILDNSCKYSVIESGTKNNLKVVEEKVLDESKLNDMTEQLKKNTIYDIKIDNREKLVFILNQMQIHKEFSTAILTDGRGNIKLVLDVPDSFFNQQPKNLNGFFKNLARNNGCSRVFVGTYNKDTYNNILKHFEYGTIKDMVCFDSKRNLIIDDILFNDYDLFDKEKKQKMYGDKDVR